LRCRFTFLATLFLLLFVSSAIILRSFILRRRFRRRIEEAILAGVIPPPHTARVSRRRAIGEKPKLWEARVYPAADDRWDAIAVRRHLYSFISPLPPPRLRTVRCCTVISFLACSLFRPINYQPNHITNFLQIFWPLLLACCCAVHRYVRKYDDGWECKFESEFECR
jgi:hypothetical protein